MTRNRIILNRAIEEAEGYIELGCAGWADLTNGRPTWALTVSMLEHALHALQRRGALVHGNGKACYLLGAALRELSRYEEALLPLQRSADLLPDDIHVLLALGWCYKRTGQLSKAIEVLERAVEVDPSEAVLHYNLACYWCLARNRTLALRFLSQALEIDSNFRDQIAKEPDFDALRNDSAFIALTSVTV